MSMVLVAGLVPCVVLLWYINKKDSIEKEPTGLLVKLIFLGCLSTIPAMVLELVGTNILTSIGMDETSYLYIFVENFFIVALAEEGCKKLMLRLGSWKNPRRSMRDRKSTRLNSSHRSLSRMPSSA